MMSSTTTLPRTADIVVIGGGAMGASIVYHLAVRSPGRILLLEKEQFFGQGASGRNAGGVRYQFATEVNIQLSLESLPMLERFEAEVGQPIDYRKCGYLFLLTRDQDVAQFRNNAALQQSLGVPTEWWEYADVKQCLPMMSLEDVLAATFCAEDGIINPNGLVMGYIQAAQRHGVQAITSVSVTGINVKNGKTISVGTNVGKISTPLVVNAAGPWAGLIGQMAGVSIPISPVRRQWLTTTPLSGIPPDFPFVIDFAQSLYFHREGAGLLTGMSNPDEQPGFDQNIDPQFELRHMEAAIARLPMLEKAGVVSRLAGLYEVTPDAHPIFGKTPVEGFYMCGGFSGHGLMHAPIAGKLLSEIILDGRANTLDVSMLNLSRFAAGREIREYNVV